MDLCDRRLLSVKVPDRISRTPRSLSDFKRWKGTKCMCFYNLDGVVMF
jgi:hypothetical protein